MTLPAKDQPSYIEFEEVHNNKERASNSITNMQMHHKNDAKLHNLCMKHFGSYGIDLNKPIDALQNFLTDFIGKEVILCRVTKCKYPNLDDAEGCVFYYKEA